MDSVLDYYLAKYVYNFSETETRLVTLENVLRENGIYSGLHTKFIQSKLLPHIEEQVLFYNADSETIAAYRSIYKHYNYAPTFNIHMLKTITMCMVAGYTEDKTYKYLNIPYNVWLTWKRFSLVTDAIERGYQDKVLRVKDALFRSATGYTETEDKVVSYMGDHEIIPVRKSYAPNTKAIELVLINHTDYKVQPEAGTVNADDTVTEWDIRQRYVEEQLKNG